MSLKRTAWLAAALLAGAATTASAEPEWVAASGRPCEQVCGSRGLSPIASGVHAPGGRATRDRFYVCAADMNGYRPGYNLQPKWSRACFVGYGGKEVAAKDYVCACE